MPFETYSRYATVVLDHSIKKTLDYGVPEKWLHTIQPGIRIEVPVRGHLKKGYVFEVKDASKYANVLPIAHILSETNQLTNDLFALAKWIASYYHAPLSVVLRSMIPSSIRKETRLKQQLLVMRGRSRQELKHYCTEIRQKSPAQAGILDVMLTVKKGILLTELLEKSKTSRAPVDTLSKKGLLLLDIVRVDRSPLLNAEYFQPKPKKLSAEQALALSRIVTTLKERQFQTHLIHGVTGSGKTEIYLQAIDHALKAGLSAIILVPEIALTPQTIERVRSRFTNEKIATLHCRLSDGERFDQWQNMRQGNTKIVIGARSAIFSPLPHLGLIIIDEEHEHSYKQSEESPCYNARDVAVMRGKLTNSVVILGSATPSIESYHNAVHGKYLLSQLHERAEASSKVTVAIVDMRQEFQRANGWTSFSEKLLEGIKKRQAIGEQTIVFLNRRGYHSTLFCRQCQDSIKCSQCDLSLTFHRGENTLACHLCGYTLSPPPRACPKCHLEETMKYSGVGTELIEKSLHAILPNIRTIRIDADTTRHKGSHQKLLQEFGRGKADVLIGTQMIAKGLHFSEVTLVGVINCDMTLNIPDFRSSELAFQLMTQVGGRAGRGLSPGEVILQTCMPENTTIQLASQQDYAAFYQEEIISRQLFAFPPFSNLIKIGFSGEDAQQTFEVADQYRKRLLSFLNSEYEIHPVLPAGHPKIKNRYRFQFLIKGPNVYQVNRALKESLETTTIPSKIKCSVDVNPTSTFF